MVVFVGDQLDRRDGDRWRVMATPKMPSLRAARRSTLWPAMRLWEVIIFLRGRDKAESWRVTFYLRKDARGSALRARKGFGNLIARGTSVCYAARESSPVEGVSNGIL